MPAEVLELLPDAYLSDGKTLIQVKRVIDDDVLVEDAYTLRMRNMKIGDLLHGWRSVTPEEVPGG